MDKLYVWVVRPDDYPHSQCFAEVAESISKSLDIPVWWAYPPKHMNARAIVLGAHLLPPMFVLPHNSIIYNLEVVGDHLMIPYLDHMRNATVWDYSLQNIERLKEYGIEAKHCPIGYHPCLEKIQDNPSKDIDVLFYGSVNQRREKIYRDLAEAGVKVQWAFNFYGKERDDLIARSRIVLNMHYYEDAPFEIVRCSYLFSNKIPVVSEMGSDWTSEYPFMGGVYFSPYDDLVGNCIKMIRSQDMRDGFAEKGYDLFTKTSMEANVRAVL